MTRALIILASVALSGCVSLPNGAVTWRGYADGRIKVYVSSPLPLPTQGWLVESDKDQAAGFISFTEWGSGSFRYKKQAYFQVRDKWEPEIVYIGRFETREGSNEFCAANPEHGGFQDGDTFVITNSYDYCARLSRE